MKNLLFTFLTFISMQTFAQNNGFVVNGTIRGKADGKPVKLTIVNDQTAREEEQILDKTVIKDGKFTLKGVVKTPERCQLIIDNTPKGKTSGEEYFLLESFYLENSNIQFSAHIDSLPAYYWDENKKIQEPVITGSYSEDIYQAFQKENEPLNKELSRLDKRYMEEYHLPTMEGKYNTKTGIQITREMKAVRKKLDTKQMEFIEKYYNTVPAYDMAILNFMGGDNALTGEKINKLQTLISKGFAGTEKEKKFLSSANAARNSVVGTPYKDFELITPDGKKAKVSQYMKPGKVTMLEFWASWCGPCRGEIPHIKELKKEYGDNFHVISISLDTKDADWKKALKEEKMTWPQLVDYKDWEGEYSKAYNITGIPYSVVLDGEGKVLQTNLRGAELDMVLEDLKLPKAPAAPAKAKK